MQRRTIEGIEYEAFATGFGRSEPGPFPDGPTRPTIQITRLSDGAIGTASIGATMDLATMADDAWRAIIQQAFG